MKRTTLYGWTFNIILMIAFISFLAASYPQEGYDAATRARMDELVANITPLSVADLGIDAEQFMEGK